MFYVCLVLFNYAEHKNVYNGASYQFGKWKKILKKEEYSSSSKISGDKRNSRIGLKKGYKDSTIG